MYGLEFSIAIRNNREPFKEDILGIILRLQALQTWVVATEERTRFRIVERSRSHVFLGVRIYENRFETS